MLGLFVHALVERVEVDFGFFGHAREAKARVVTPAQVEVHPTVATGSAPLPGRVDPRLRGGDGSGLARSVRRFRHPYHPDV
ncbi:hypothetical protein tb265_33260 [Gemmatimonadetes bacterium T265]|nr:hypothetical protein tb265_33260 [Gemmatimonadetes bacterium T265]